MMIQSVVSSPYFYVESVFSCSDHLLELNLGEGVIESFHSKKQDVVLVQIYS